MESSVLPKAIRWASVAFVLAVSMGTPVNISGQAPSGSNPKQATFTKDIAPILQRSCQSCHRPGSVAPMSLLTYEEVRPWASAIKHRTSLVGRPDVMPPWFIDRTVGIQHYKGDMSLSSEELAKVAAWVDAGAPRGNPADMPPPLVFADNSKWQLGQPNLVVSSPSFEIAATSPDRYGPVGITPTGLTEDRYVAWVEVKEVTDSVEAPEGGSTRRTVGGQFIFHHLGWVPLGTDGRPYDSGGVWPVHEVGRNPDVFDPEAGMLLKAGSTLSFTGAHVHANGKKTKAHVEVAMKFHPKGYKPTKKLTDNLLWVRQLDIVGNEANQKFEAFRVLQENTRLMVFEPHMHAAGVRMCLEAMWGNTFETLTCAGYNHGWVRVYSYDDDAQPLLPKGTILRMTAYFDTTAANKNVSDPRNWQGLGQRSIDNMCNAVVTGVSLSDQEFQQQMLKRREKLRLTEGQGVIGCPLCGYVKDSETSTVVRR